VAAAEATSSSAVLKRHRTSLTMALALATQRAALDRETIQPLFNEVNPGNFN
jgi:hypothetical protein